jgi:hypothetical protein
VTVSKGSTERREHARYPAVFEIEGSVPAKGEVARMKASNLSAGGLYCTSDVGFDEMTMLSVRLMLPSGNGDGAEPLDVEAVVVRRVPLESSVGNSRYELALYFPRLDDTQRDRINGYLAVHAS